MRFSLLSMNLLAACAFLAVPVLGQAPAATRPAKVSWASRLEGLILEHTNTFRQEEKLAALVVDPRLGQAARYLAEYMALNDKFSHTADEREPHERAELYKYTGVCIGENIAWEYMGRYNGEELSRNFFETWKESEPHKNNMLGAEADEIGVGVATDGKGRFFAVQMFGRGKE